MSQALQQKYEQLQKLCKKQQLQIIRLQNDIRERYQSYLLYTSRYKKQQMNQSQPILNLQSSIKSTSSIRKEQQLSKSRIEWQQQKNQFYEQRRRVKILKFDIQKQIQVAVQPDKQTLKAKNDQVLTITLSYKDRIAALNNTKNQAIRKLEKNQNQLKELKQKHQVLLIQNDTIKKSQKKLKDKLKKFPEYEQKVDDIYKQLMKEIQSQGTEIQPKHIHDQLEQIISWICQNKNKVHTLLQNFNQIEEESQYPTQIIQKVKPKPSQFQSNKKTEPFIPQKIHLTIQSVQSFSHSPFKRQPKLVQQNWTIISKLNQIDINPLDESQVKLYNETDQVQKQKKQTKINEELEDSYIYQEQLRQSQNQINTLNLQLSKIRNNYKQIHQEKRSLLQKLSQQQSLQRKIKQLNQLLQKNNKKNIELTQQLKNAHWISSQYKQELINQKQRNNKIKQQLQKSQLKYSQLQQSRLTATIQALKQSKIRQKLNATQADVSNSKITINQQLQAPYFVEEQLQCDSNNQYVKRSFIRKKIVKRNLSATTYRIVSKSKEEVDQIVTNKIGQYRDKSKEKANKLKTNQKITKQAKFQALQNSVNRVSQVSQPRDSDINRNDQVRIIEVTTITPNQLVQTAKIYSKGGQSNLSTRRKY